MFAPPGVPGRKSAAAPFLVVVTRVSGSRRILGGYLNGNAAQLPGWLTARLMAAAAIALFAAIGASVDWIANFALIEVFPAGHNAIGLGWVMVCFAVIAVLAIGFVYRWLPETKGLSVEEAVSVFERQADAKQAAA